MNLEAASSRWYRNLLLAALGIFLIVLAAFFSRWRQQMLRVPATELEQVRLVEQEVMETYAQAKTAYDERKIDVETFVGVIKSEVLAPWREAESRLQQVDFDRLPDKARRRFEALSESMKLREQAWRLIIDSLHEGSDEGLASAAQKSAEADRLIEDEFFGDLEAGGDVHPDEGVAK